MTEIVHAVPPTDSGLTPCCGRTPIELPLTDRITSEETVTCPGPLLMPGEWHDAPTADAERYKADYLRACETIAQMHAAATGRPGEGPTRGVVEDVEDVRLRAERAEAAIGRVHDELADCEDDDWMVRAGDIRDALESTPTGSLIPPVLQAAIDQADKERETAARVFAGLHRSAEDTVTRVIDLYENWVKAGPPPLGVSMARWWDKRLVELRAALQQDGQQPAPPAPVDWRGVLRGFQALLDAFPADLHPGGPAVSCCPQPTQLVARWRDTVRAARAQLAADRCCGKPPGAICVHDIAPSVNQTTEK